MSNLNFNKVIIGGRLTSDPELKTTPSGISVTSFTVAVNRRGKSDETDFLNCTAWRNAAEFITKYFRKGSSICIVGSLQNRNWTDNDGDKHYATDIVVDETYFVDSKGESTAPSQPASAPTTYIPTAYTEAPRFDEIDDPDCPF